MSNHVLIVDDEPKMCDLIATDLRLREISSTSCNSASEALNLAREKQFDVVLTDIRMPGTSGIQLCRELTTNRPDIPVVVMTAFGSMETAIEAIRAGAYDFVTKPIEMELLALTIGRAIKHRQLQEQISVLKRSAQNSNHFGEMIGDCPPMLELYEQLGRVSRADTSVLITGESGTGKELVARSIHANSDRAANAFVAVNCAALSETLLESELFGHAKGAFTDARNTKKGLFIEADGGTLLLDEIGDMPMPMQIKLLRALEERKVRPVGGSEEIPFDVRLVAATNRDLELAVEEERFRSDLYYRVNVIQVEIPPLRARGTDILLLAQSYLEHFAAKTGNGVKGISNAAAERLLDYSWPGNVRELRNVIERAVVLTRFDQISIEDLPERIQKHVGRNVVFAGDNPTELLPMEEVEKRYILHVLDVVGNNQTLAAQKLGMHRKTLSRKLKQYGVAKD